MDFGDGLAQPFLHLGRNLRQGHGIGLGVVSGLAKGAKPTAIDTDIAIVQMLVINIVGSAAMEAFPHQVGQISHPQKVPAAIEGNPVFPGESLLIPDFLI